MSDADHADLSGWDASYVLGALTAADRRVYEAHLEQCPLCKAAVAELAPMPGLLSRTPPVPVSAPLPGDLMNRVLNRARKRRTRRHRAIWVLAASIVVILAIGVPAGIQLSHRPDTTSVALAPVRTVEMRAEVSFESVAWGTRLSIECRYSDDAGWSTSETEYGLQITDVDDRTTLVSTWGVVPGRTATMDASTAVPFDRIASVAIVDRAGEVMHTELN